MILKDKTEPGRIGPTRTPQTERVEPRVIASITPAPAFIMVTQFNKASTGLISRPVSQVRGRSESDPDLEVNVSRIECRGQVSESSAAEVRAEAYKVRMIEDIVGFGAELNIGRPVVREVERRVLPQVEIEIDNARPSKNVDACVPKLPDGRERKRRLETVKDLGILRKKRTESKDTRNPPESGRWQNGTRGPRLYCAPQNMMQSFPVYNIHQAGHGLMSLQSHCRGSRQTQGPHPTVCAQNPPGKTVNPNVRVSVFQSSPLRVSGPWL